MEGLVWAPIDILIDAYVDNKKNAYSKSSQNWCFSLKSSNKAITKKSTEHLTPFIFWTVWIFKFRKRTKQGD
jgi:hypothetical protein